MYTDRTHNPIPHSGAIVTDPLVARLGGMMLLWTSGVAIAVAGSYLRENISSHIVLSFMDGGSCLFIYMYTMSYSCPFITHGWGVSVVCPIVLPCKREASF